MPTERVTFTGHSGDELAARLDLPDGPHLATALFAHCFTCSKDIPAARRIASRLASMGVAVLRFDFTGLGHSGGEFENTTFTSNVGDLTAAANYLKGRGMAPSLLIGHSLGGAAVLRAAGDIAGVKAVTTIGAPFDPEHVTHNFGDALDTILSDGKAEVNLGGPPLHHPPRVRTGRGGREARAPDRVDEGGTSGAPRAPRRRGGHRERHTDLSRRQAPQELRDARRCRPPDHKGRRCRIRRRRDRGLGRQIP